MTIVKVWRHVELGCHFATSLRGQTSHAKQRLKA
jgi:hypothetical protein